MRIIHIWRHKAREYADEIMADVPSEQRYELADFAADWRREYPSGSDEALKAAAEKRFGSLVVTVVILASLVQIGYYVSRWWRERRHGEECDE